MSTFTGVPAFPIPGEDHGCAPRFESGYGGMALRDYFAAKALPVILSKLPLDGLLSESFPEEESKLIAEASYKFANAMIQAREASNV